MQEKFPDYVVINDPDCTQTAVLRTPAKSVEFPLSPEIQKIAKILEAKFDHEENCAGLAAPQIGYGWQIIVFAVSDDPNLKKFRTDLVDTMPKSVWFNPIYKPVGSNKRIDWEGCFSVFNLAGNVPRFEAIEYEAYNSEGKKIVGRATGFLARLIQHEIDHLNAKLFIDLVPEKDLISRDDYQKKRHKKISPEKEE